MNKIPDAVLTQHTAILGKTGSGKTSTAKLLVEQAVAQGHSVCILDPIKSDWWGITSNRDGSGPGLPFQILGGPHGHVPLQPEAGEAVGELVATNKLPLSIIDMSRFGPGGLSKFFLGFAPAIAKKPRRVLYVVLEEAHEFGPKERAGGNDENMLVYWSKRLATAGRVAGIRLVVATQRVQSLHNALLSSCDSMIAHRLTFPADQKPVIDWFAANIGKDRAAEVSSALSTLQTGEGFVGSGEARLFERMKFAKMSTFDNTSTPTGDDANHQIKTAPVNAEGLKALLGKAVTEAIENDPKQLKAEVAKLKKQLSDALAQPVTIHADKRVQELEQQVAGLREASSTSGAGIEYALSMAEGAILDAQRYLNRWRAIEESGRADKASSDKALNRMNGVSAPNPVETNGMHHALEREAPRREAIREPDSAGRQTGSSAARAPAPRAPHHESAPARESARAGQDLTTPQRKLINSVAWWNVVGIWRPTRAQVAVFAGYTPTGGTFRNLLSECRSGGLIDYVEDAIVLAERGTKEAVFPERALSLADLHDGVCSILTKPQAKVLSFLFAHKTSAMPRDHIAALNGYEVTGGTWRNLVSELKTLGVITYPNKKTMAAAAWLFPKELS
jgi:uncharacterized protein